MRSLSTCQLISGLSVLALLSGNGCGSSDKSCSDACKALFDCADKLGVAPKDFLGSYYTTVNTCIDRCNSGDCAGKQQLINCSSDLQCIDVTQAKKDITACFMNSSCSP